MSTSEAAIQQQIRIEASRRGWRLWRNNNGVATNPNGQPIRYGLANDSKSINEQVKSGDTIGIAQLLITQEMVGMSIGVFASAEVKKAGWRYTGTKREVAQLRWAEMVRALGGLSWMTSGNVPTGSYVELICTPIIQGDAP